MSIYTFVCICVFRIIGWLSHCRATAWQSSMMLLSSLRRALTRVRSVSPVSVYDVVV